MESLTLALEMRGIQKRFPGVQALQNVSFAVRRGSVHGFIGENGAGKSTLMRILAGAIKADKGDIVIDGEKIPEPSPEKMLDRGVAVIHQELVQAQHLTVAENIFLGRWPATRFGAIDWHRVNVDAGNVLNGLGFKIVPTARIDALSVAQRQMVEIAKAIARNARIVVLDEPSAVLGDAELEHLFRVIRRLSREGVAFIYITHRLKELYDICEEVTVMRDGQIVVSMPIAQATTASLIQNMVGRALPDVFPPRAEPGEDIRLNVSGVSRVGAIKDITFDVRRGEIVGICGLAGSGRTEVLRAIAGADSIDSGEIKIDGAVIAPGGPRNAFLLGVGLLPEDRKTEGLFLDQSVAFNVTISNLGRLTTFGLISGRKENELVSRYISDLKIKARGGQTQVRSLSGGNQQKCGIARQLNAGTEILLIDEPTRGVDVAAKREIYDLIVQLTRERGASIVMVSSELPEILGLCNRIVVMRSGAVAAFLDGPSATEESIMAQAV